MYVLSYHAEFQPQRNRLTAFFRLIVVIPWLIWASLYGIAAFVAVVIAWFALLFTAKFPRSLYDFIAGYVRFAVRLQAFLYLVTDAFPPFGGTPDPSYPVQVDIGPPQERYSRMKTFFRWLLAIPIYVLRYVLALLLEVAAVAAWFVIVITGRQLPGIHSALALGMAYTARSDAYLFLLTDSYPPFTVPGELEVRDGGELPPAPPAPSAPATPAPGGFAPPQAPAGPGARGATTAGDPLAQPERPDSPPAG
jgi:hypothetical protein